MAHSAAAAAAPFDLAQPRGTGARDLELEEAVCHFNNEEFPLGTYVQSGDEVLKCTGRGVWERRGDKHP